LIDSCTQYRFSVLYFYTCLVLLVARTSKRFLQPTDTSGWRIGPNRFGISTRQCNNCPPQV